MADAEVVTTPTPTPAESAPVSLRDLSETQYGNWLKTGELPTSKAEPEPASAAAPASPTADDTPPDAVAQVPAESAADKKGKPRHDPEARIGQMNEQRKAALERAEAAERRVAELEARSNPVTPAPTPTQPTAKLPTFAEQVKRYQAEVDYPKLADFLDAGFDDPYAACNAAQGLYIQNKQFAEREQASQALTMRQKAEANVDRTWNEGKAKYPDWDLSPLQGLTGQSAAIVAQLAFESPLSVDVLNHLSKHPSEARALAAMEPFAAAHALGKLESSLSTPSASRVATQTVSKAPEPPTRLGERHTPDAKDEVADAVASGDTGRYIELQNARDYAALKGGRR